MAEVTPNQQKPHWSQFIYVTSLVTIAMVVTGS